MIVSIQHKGQMPPVHPGIILKEMYLEPNAVNITQLAENLGVARKTISELINGHMGVSAEMAIRLSQAFDTTPELWLNMQLNYDLWVARSKWTIKPIRSLRKKMVQSISHKKTITHTNKVA